MCLRLKHIFICLLEIKNIGLVLSKVERGVLDFWNSVMQCGIFRVCMGGKYGCGGDRWLRKIELVW